MFGFLVFQAYLGMLHGTDFFNPDLSLVFFQSMVDELCCGPCLAMEIRAPDAPVTFREFVGPSDPVSCLHHNSTNFTIRCLPT